MKLFHVSLGLQDKQKLILDLVEHHDMQFAPTNKAVRRVKTKYDADFIRKWAVLRQADRDDHVYPKVRIHSFILILMESLLTTLDVIENESKSFKITDIAINGNVLIQELGFKKGPIIGDILYQLFEKVKAGELDHKYDVLLNEAAIFKDMI